MKIISGRRAAPRKIILYGQRGVGKSSWAAAAPNTLILNIEDGLENLDCERTPPLKSTGDVIECLSWLYSNEHHYRRVALDSVDWFEKLIHKEAVRAIGRSDVQTLADVGYGKGYPKAIPYWENLLGWLDALRQAKSMDIILLGHAKVEKVQPPDVETYDKYSLDLHKEAASTIEEWADDVLFASFRVNTRKVEEGHEQKRGMAIGGKERYIRTAETAAASAKNRINGMPTEIPMSWETYAGYVKAHYAGAKPVTAADAPEPAPSAVREGQEATAAAVSEEAAARF